jgi:ADP-ribose pyrophosphatase YjhB (NUDIX family)
MQSTNEIRPLALGLIEHDNKILVFKADDFADGRVFYRVLGGGIEFRETAEQALHREFLEETGSDVKDAQLLAVLENIFDYENRHHHEIIFLFRANLVDQSLYGKNFPIEDSTHNRSAEWVDKEELKKALFFPEGIKDFL